jgi:hypothetical protein
MLHVATTETKQRNDPANAAPAPEPRREFRDRMASPGAYLHGGPENPGDRGLSWRQSARQLQRTMGNRALVRMVDRHAARSPATPVPAVRLQRKCACGGSGGECESCKGRREDTRQRKEPSTFATNQTPPLVERPPWSGGAGASFGFGRIPIRPEQGRPVEFDPNDPLAECGVPPDAGTPKVAPSDAGTPKGAAPAVAKKCCGCIKDIKIQNIKKINADRSYGHSFDTVFSLSYIEAEGAANDLSLEWLEKTNRGYTDRMRKANNVWYDMTQDPETSGSFDDSWGSRTKPCPGKETITDTDPPTASLDLPARTLEFKITVKSGAGCKCASASKTVTAKQVLEPTTDAPPKVKTQSFTTS